MQPAEYDWCCLHEYALQVTIKFFNEAESKMTFRTGHNYIQITNYEKSLFSLMVAPAASQQSSHLRPRYFITVPNCIRSTLVAQWSPHLPQWKEEVSGCFPDWAALFFRL